MLFFLGLVFLLPFLALGKDLALDFWGFSWFLLPLILALAAGMDCYFALNYRVYILLEKEDWPALAQELEDKVFRRGRYSSRLVRLLANTYLVLSDPRAVNALERKLATAKSGLVNRHALIFGAARLLDQDYAGAAEFFSAQLAGRAQPGGGGASSAAEWIRWYYGFSLLLAHRFEEAADTFITLAGKSEDGLLAGLSAYFLSSSLSGFLPPRAGELGVAAAAGKDRVRRRLRDRAAWDKECKRLEMEVYAAVLVSYMTKTGDYLYG
jgi:hypothetical protein